MSCNLIKAPPSPGTSSPSTGRSRESNSRHGRLSSCTMCAGYGCMRLGLCKPPCQCTKFIAWISGTPQPAHAASGSPRARRSRQMPLVPDVALPTPLHQQTLDKPRCSRESLVRNPTPAYDHPPSSLTDNDMQPRRSWSPSSTSSSGPTGTLACSRPSRPNSCSPSSC